MGFAFIIGCAAAFAFITPFSRISYDSGSTPLTIVTLRTGAFVLVALAMLLARRQKLRLSRHGLLNSLWLSLTAYGMSVGYLSSVAFIPVSLAVLILYTSPLLAGLMSAVTGRERLTLGKSAAIVLAFIGLAVAIGPTSPRWIGAASPGRWPPPSRWPRPASSAAARSHRTRRSP